MNEPISFCKCGCGNKTRIAPVNDRTKGWVKGKPLAFIKGYNITSESKRRSLKTLGNRTIHSNGYVMINMGSGRRKYEHIDIAEKALGRKLKNSELVIQTLKSFITLMEISKITDLKIC